MKRWADDARPISTRPAEQHHPGRLHINVDAELAASHPSREHNLGDEGKRRGSNTDQEGGRCDALREPSDR